LCWSCCGLINRDQEPPTYSGYSLYLTALRLLKWFAASARWYVVCSTSRATDGNSLEWSFTTMSSDRCIHCWKQHLPYRSIHSIQSSGINKVLGKPGSSVWTAMRSGSLLRSGANIIHAGFHLQQQTHSHHQLPD